MLGKLLNGVLGEGKEGVLRAQRINGQHLPEYDAVRRYFGPAGMTAVSEDDGWFLTGFTLSKEPPATLAEKPADANEPRRPRLPPRVRRPSRLRHRRPSNLPRPSSSSLRDARAAGNSLRSRCQWSLVPPLTCAAVLLRTSEAVTMAKPARAYFAPSRSTFTQNGCCRSPRVRTSSSSVATSGVKLGSRFSGRPLTSIRTGLLKSTSSGLSQTVTLSAPEVTWIVFPLIEASTRTG